MMQLLAAIQVKDAFSGSPVVDERVRFYFKVKRPPGPSSDAQLQGAKEGKTDSWIQWYPVCKSDGFHAFTRLPDGEPHLRITCPGFFDFEQTLVTPLRPPLVDAIAVCELKPSPAYSYPIGTTVIRGRITTTRPPEHAALASGDAQQGERPLGGVEVSGEYGDGSKTCSTDTRTASKDAGVCHGRYALALSGEFAARRTGGGADEIVVSMTFEKTGYDTVTKKIRAVPGRTTIMTDIAMQ